MGYAIGVIGMRLEDLDAMTTREFEAVAEAHRERHESLMQDAWERMRLLASIVIQPHCKKKLTPHALLPFPWDSKRKSKDAPEISREEHEARFNRLKEKRQRR